MGKGLLEKLDVESRQILREFGALADKTGIKVYLVGGVVRDLALGLPNGDLDVTVAGNGIALARAFAGEKGGSLTTYPSFGTATVTLPGGRTLDVASARKEKYVKPGAFPAVQFSGIADDLFRRDFTINAMAVAVNALDWGTLVDPHNGMGDLGAKEIRVMHPLSFIDDPTRIARAARFAARLGFTVETQTLRLIREAVASGAMATIKPQRQLKEIKKISKEPHGKEALDYLKAWGVPAAEEKKNVPH